MMKFEIRQSTIYYTGLLGRWDKRIIDQESDVSSIIFFIIFIDLGHSKRLHSKRFIFIFVILYKKRENKLKGFLQRSLQEIMKKIILGTSDDHPIDPATRRIKLKIVGYYSSSTSFFLSPKLKSS